MRPEGVGTKELAEATGWHGCPWRWTITSNKHGAGLAGRYGYNVEEVDGVTHYFLFPKQEAGQTAAA